MAAQAYQLGRSNEVCFRCGSAFKTAEVYVSALKEDREGGLVREDYCRACWDDSAVGFFSFWQTRRRPDSVAGDGMDEDAVFSFYRELQKNEGGDRNVSELKYVLSLYLARKKVLKLVEVVRRQDGREALVFEGPEKGKLTDIDDPGLSASRIEELTETIHSLFTILPP